MDALFTGYTFRHLNVKNRFARSSTHDYLGNPDGSVTQDEMDLYRSLAMHEVGLLFSAHLFVKRDGMASANQNSIASDKDIPLLKVLVQASQMSGCKVIAQISHAGNKAVLTDSLQDVNTMAETDFQEMAESFAQAARRAQEAGFDGVEVHCAHGYFLSQCVDLTSNRRTDQRGGSIENRFRIVTEIFARIRALCGKDYPVFMKINSNSQTDNEAYERDLLWVCQTCDALEIDGIELSGISYRAFQTEDSVYYLPCAAKIAKQTSIPIILVGGIQGVEQMHACLNAGMAMVSICRPLLCEPDLIVKIQKGKLRGDCLKCNQCGNIYKTNGKRCVLHNLSYPHLIENK